MGRREYLYGGGLRLDTEHEQAVYEHAANECLRDPRVARRLHRRPGVTEEAVRQAIWQDANVRRALEPCEETHRELREAMLRLSEALETPFAGLTEWKAFSYWRLWAMFFALVFVVGALTGDRALLALAVAAVFVVLAVVPAREAFSGSPTAEPELWAGPLLRPVLAATVRRAERAWTRDLVESGVGPLALRVVDALLGEDPDGLLLPESHDGLRASYDPGFLVPGRAAEQLRHGMDQIDGGTIAVCGPRGVGKTGDVRAARLPAVPVHRAVLRELLVDIAQERHDREQRVVIAIDEVDRLGSDAMARQLIDEASAYAYFSLTLLDIFAEEGYGRRRERAAAQGADGDPELLAEARRELGVSPYSTRSLLTVVRTAWGLSTGIA